MSRILIAFSLALSLAASPPAFLSSLWSDSGSHLDPDGVPAPQGDEGSHLDPDGAPAPQTDIGPQLDPNG